MDRIYIDLHRHFDGCLTLDIIKHLAKIQNITLPTDNDIKLKELIQIPDTCSCIEEYLSKYDLPLSLLQTKDAITEAMYLVLENCIKENLIYVELRFAPQLHTLKGLTQDEVVIAALEGLKKSKMKANLILCMMRNLNNYNENLETINICKKHLVSDGGVVALDIAGSELLNRTINYKDLFSYAKSLGIPFTIHAGETDDVSSVKDAVSFGALRIGHGIKCYHDEEFQDYLKEHNIVLEMCPLSNMFSKASKDIAKYPFKRFLNKGIKVTLNTDGPGVQGTCIQDEYNTINFMYEITQDDYIKIMENAIYGAFTTNEVKDTLRKKLYESIENI